MNLKNNVKMFFLLAVSLAIGEQVCFGQSPNIQVIKKECTYDAKYSGSKLILHYQDDLLNITSSTEYWLDSFIVLSDASKLLIVEKLLNYGSDSALCCMNVISRSFNGIEGCKAAPKNVKRYTIQVDALYMINRLCWPKSMEFYSCSPVLYDNKTKISINNNQEKIKQVFADYKKWFAACKEQKKIPSYFPFNDGRYVWYGSRKSIGPRD